MLKSREKKFPGGSFLVEPVSRTKKIPIKIQKNYNKISIFFFHLQQQDKVVYNLWLKDKIAKRIIKSWLFNTTTSINKAG